LICPFCNNEVQDKALKCRFCKKWINNKTIEFSVDDSIIRIKSPFQQAFSYILDFSYERSFSQSIAFYLAHLFFVMLIAVALVSSLSLLMPWLNMNSYSIGNIAAFIYCSILIIIGFVKKRLYKSFTYLIMAVIAVPASIYGGGMFGLLFPAYFSTLPCLPEKGEVDFYSMDRLHKPVMIAVFNIMVIICLAIYVLVLDSYSGQTKNDSSQVHLQKIVADTPPPVTYKALELQRNELPASAI